MDLIRPVTSRVVLVNKKKKKDCWDKIFGNSKMEKVQRRGGVFHVHSVAAGKGLCQLENSGSKYRGLSSSWTQSAELKCSHKLC